ncbi:MAG: acetyl-CoA C-acyltransferase, partial [Candidatus Korarchaeota archaeon]|nr:acetyl-CoA C-acyltransferase [Candidatus Korarchaeota archaeon]NIU82747.1 acetyl-CoA C-acyltransferase [Candidatus Thorarchaeota archaeon]NIW14169.1 acetyl-CoA C-acyltransferase [Candidatus Thorarchaeota archaeon]NIW52272.1 acetyl-CoA C-acyltransferase [Candidatus Korarchaeota archaeon]
MNNVEIVSAKRTPIGKYLQSLKYVSPIKLGSTVMKAVMKETHLPPSELDFYIMGNTLSAGLGQNPGRIAAIKAGIPPHIGGFTIDHVCASSLTSVVLGAEKILAGKA